MTYNLRYIAQIVIEADSPLNISSGEHDLLTDSIVMTDANGLPMIPGTSLCGVLRHTFSEKSDKTVENSIFGYQGDGNKGAGSRIIVSNAHFMGPDGVIEGIKIDLSTDFYVKYSKLPIREHCKIAHTGSTDVYEHGKFDNQIVYKGTRFKFELEFIGNVKEKDHWDSILNAFKDKGFRIGGGTRKGYGKLKIISINTVIFDLTKEEELNAYLNKSSRLSDNIGQDPEISQPENDNWIEYVLELTPENFYIFGSGFGDEDVDMTPVYEDVVEWKDKRPEFINKKILIPASSVKGAISHRVAFHYNKLKEIYADKKNIKDFTGENNPAVCALFGFKKDSKSNDAEKKKGQRGNVILSDVFIENSKNEKVLNHVAIDRFTGGAKEGALFDEKVITQNNKFNLEILVNKKAFNNDSHKKMAFENTLKDITTGMLPLGGGTMRGHGCFLGKLLKEGKEVE